MKCWLGKARLIAACKWACDRNMHGLADMFMGSCFSPSGDSNWLGGVTCKGCGEESGVDECLGR